MVEFVFKLFLTGGNPNHAQACEGLRRLCEEHLRGRYELQVIDIKENPEVAEEENILATPTLLKVSPKPMRRLLGDLSAAKTVLEALEISDKPCVAPERRSAMQQSY